MILSKDEKIKAREKDVFSLKNQIKQLEAYLKDGKIENKDMEKILGQKNIIISKLQRKLEYSKDFEIIKNELKHEILEKQLEIKKLEEEKKIFDKDKLELSKKENIYINKIKDSENLLKISRDKYNKSKGDIESQKTKIEVLNKDNKNLKIGLKTVLKERFEMDSMNNVLEIQMDKEIKTFKNILDKKKKAFEIFRNESISKISILEKENRILKEKYEGDDK